MKSAYKANNIYFKYTNHWVVEDISFNIRDGEFFGIIGPNGSGKSSLLKLISRIYIPQKGRISLRKRYLFLEEMNYQKQFPMCHRSLLFFFHIQLLK